MEGRRFGDGLFWWRVSSACNRMESGTNKEDTMENRRIVLEGTINTRDLGGLKTRDGRAIRKGLLIRTDCLYRITPHDVETLRDKYHALYDVDFRNRQEYEERPEVPIPGCTVVHLSITDDHNMGKVPPAHKTYGIEKKRLLTLFDYIYCLSDEGDAVKGMEKSYRSYVATEKGQRGYSTFLRTVLQADGRGAVLFHCADGKDRAGVGCMLLLRLLGVDDETIVQDYLLTNESVREKKERRLKELLTYGVEEPLRTSAIALAGVKENWLRAAMDEIDRDFHGFDAYRRERLHVSDEAVLQLRRTYLED